MKHKIRDLLSFTWNGRLRKKSNYLGLVLLLHFQWSAATDSAAGIRLEMEMNGSYIVSTEVDSSSEKMKNKPKWVDMMYDPNVNYYEAKKEFQDFWKDRGEPVEKHAEKEEEKRSLVKRILKSDKKLEAENTELLLPYKRFRKWLSDMEPFVQPDGSVLSIEEQKKIWENSRK